MAYKRRESETIDVIRLTAGVVFLCSAIVRMFHHSDGVAEMTRLHLPGWFSSGVILFDLAMAAMFVLDVQVRTGAAICIGFLSVSLLLGFWFYGSEIWSRINEVFVFMPTPAGMWLQFLYVLLLLVLYREAKKWS